MRKLRIIEGSSQCAIIEKLPYYKKKEKIVARFYGNEVNTGKMDAEIFIENVKRDESNLAKALGK